MAQAFNLTAQLNLRGPSNIRQVVSDIKKQVGTITGDIKFKIDPAAINNTSKLSKSLQDLNINLSNTSSNAASAAAAIRNFGQSVSSVGNSSAKLSSNISKAAKSTDQLGVSSAKAAKNVAVARTEMEEFGRQGALAIRRFAAFSAVTGLFFSLNRAVSAGVKSFIEFDKQLVRLQQVTGQNAEGLKSLQDEITRLSVGLGVSSESLVTVSSTLAQAGLSANETRAALQALARSELAPSFNDINQTVEGSIALMRQFGISAKDLEKALGSVNAVAAAFAVESSDIIAAIQRTGGVFASASKGVSEGADALNEFIAVFTSVRATTRESAETIATGLRTIFTRIQRQGTIEALKEFGVTLTDAEGKFVGAYKAIELLSQGLNRIDPRDLKFSQIVEELGGFRQIGKVIPLIQQFATAQQALKVAQAGQGSLAGDALKAQLSLANQITKVREEFLALIRSLGQGDVFQTLAKGSLLLATGLIKISGALKGVLPALTILGLGGAARGLAQFGSGFVSGLKKVPQDNKKDTSIAGSVGRNIGSSLVGAKTEQVSRDLDQNSAALDKVSGAISSLTSVISKLSNIGPGVDPTLLADLNSGIHGLGSNISNLNTSIASFQSYLLTNSSLLKNNTDELFNNTSGLNSLYAALVNLDSSIRNINPGGAGPTTVKDGGKILGFNKGGVVPGSGKGDKIPALLEPGEVVINNAVANKYGRGNLVRMNKYASGGPISIKEKIGKLPQNKSIKVGLIQDFTEADLAGEVEMNLIPQPIIVDQSIDFDWMIKEIEKEFSKNKTRYQEKPDTIGRTPIGPPITAASFYKNRGIKINDKDNTVIEDTLVNLPEPPAQWSKGRAFEELIKVKAPKSLRLKSSSSGNLTEFQDIINEHYAAIDFDSGDAKFEKDAATTYTSIKVTEGNKKQKEILSKRFRDQQDLLGWTPAIDSFILPTNALPDTEVYYPALDNTKQDFDTYYAAEYDRRTQLSSKATPTQRFARSVFMDGKKSGGLIRNFMAGSPGGIRVASGKGRGVKRPKGARGPAYDIPSTENFVEWAKGIYSEYDADPSLPTASYMGMSMPADIAYANMLLAKFLERGGSGLSTGKKFIVTPPDKIDDALRPYLVPNPNGDGSLGFFGDEAILAFQRANKTELELREDQKRADELSKRKTTSKMQRELFGFALKGIGADIEAGNFSKDQIETLKEGLPEITKNPYLQVTSLPQVKDEAAPASSSLLSSIGGPLSEFRKSGGQTSLAGIIPANAAAKIKAAIPAYIENMKDEAQKAAKARTALKYFDSFVGGSRAEKPGHATAFVETINQILKSGVVQGLAKGGMIQKFAIGEEVKPVGRISEDVLQRLRKLGGAGPIKEAVGLDYINQQIREQLAGRRITSKQLLNPSSLSSISDSAALLPALTLILAKAEDIQKKKDEAKQQQIARNLQAAAGGAYQFGLASIYGPNGELGYSSVSNAEPIEGNNGQEYLTQIVRKSLPIRYEEAIKATREDIAGLPQRAGERFQYTDIFGTGGPLAFDFDETLVKGADIFTDKGKIDFLAYNDTDKVQKALANAELTLLGKELQKRLNEYPQLMDNIRVLTARPPNNAPYLASTLSRLKLPIPESKITGVSGGLNKVDNLSELETLIDDNLENIQSVIAGGKKAIPYKESKMMDSGNASSYRALAATEGYALEEMVRNWGVNVGSDDDNDPLKPIDFPKGLGAYASKWDMPPTIPTDTKRTNSSTAASVMLDRAQKFYVDNFAQGGEAQNNIYLEKYKQILASILPKEMISDQGFLKKPDGTSEPIEIVPPNENARESSMRKMMSILLGKPMKELAGASYSGGLFYKLIRKNLYDAKDIIPEQEFSALKQFIDQNLLFHGEKDIINLAEQKRPGSFPHETFHDIQGYLLDYYPEIYARLQQSVNEQKASIEKWYSDPNTSRWRTDRDYKFKHLFPEDSLDSPYSNRVLQQAIDSTKKITKQSMSDEFYDKIYADSMKDFGRAEAIPFLLAAASEGNSSAQQILSDIFGSAGLNKDFYKYLPKFAAGGVAEEKQTKQFGKIALRNDGSNIIATYFKQGANALLAGSEMRSGQVTASKIDNNLYAVRLSAATKGYGPRLYDTVMEAATENGGMLTSDRSTVSGDAKKVWEYYFNNRGDVKKTPLKPANWTKNQALIDPKLYGSENTWPPVTDPAWILQSGYSKNPNLINDSNSVVRMDKQAQDSALTALQFFQSRQKLATGGKANSVPALVSNGEAYVPPKTAKKIGYGTLNRMNQADKNGMGRFSEGGISIFKGPGTGTSDSIPTSLPVGSFIIREKATKALGLNKGGSVGIKRFFKGGQNKKDAVRAQGQILQNVEEASSVFMEILAELPKQITDTLLAKFKGIKDVDPGQSLMKGSRPFTDSQRGEALSSSKTAAIGLKITGKKGGATTETVAHETAHLADWELGKGKAASETAGTFQFELVAKVRKQMEEAFVEAGENTDKINDYLLSGKELFAEFFAKASPEVRAIITSTTDVKEGMSKLADILGDTGYTYAGLQASDIASSATPPGGGPTVPPSVPPLPPSTPSGGGSPKNLGDFEAKVQKLLVEFENLAKAAKLKVYSEERAANSSAQLSKSLADAAASSAVVSSANQKIADGFNQKDFDPTILGEALLRIKNNADSIRLSKQDIQASRSSVGVSGAATVGQTQNPGFASDTYFQLKVKLAGQTVEQFTQTLAKNTLDLAQQLKDSLPKSLDAFQLSLFNAQERFNNLDKASATFTEDAQQIKQTISENLRDILGNNYDQLVQSNPTAGLDQFSTILENIFQKISSGQSVENAFGSSNVQKAIEFTSTDENILQRAKQQIALLNGLDVSKINVSLEDFKKALDKTKLNSEIDKISSRFGKVSLLLGSFGSVISRLLESTDSRGNAMASAGILEGTSTAGAVMAAGSETLKYLQAGASGSGMVGNIASKLLPIAKSFIGGPFGLIATASIGLAAALKASWNAAREFDKQLANKQLETSLNNISSMFDEFSKDMSKKDILGDIANQLNSAISAAFVGIKIDATVPKMFWTNMIDAAMGGNDAAAAQRSMILEKQGMGAYLSSTAYFNDIPAMIGNIIPGLGGLVSYATGSGKTAQETAARNRQGYMFELAPQLAAQQSASLKPVADNVFKLFEQRLRTGSSVDDIMKELKDGAGGVSQFAMAIARSNPIIEEQIIKTQARSDLSDIEKQKIIDGIITREAEKQTILNTSATIRAMEFEKLNKEISKFVNSLSRIYENMEMSINRASFEVQQLSNSAELASSSLSGSAKAGETRLSAVNILQNRRAYSSEDQAGAVDLASSFFGSASPAISAILNIGDKLETSILSTINRTRRAEPGATNERVLASIRSNLDRTLSDLQIPDNLVPNLSNQIRDALKDITTAGDLDNVTFEQIAEAVPGLTKQIDAARQAQEVAVKALEFYQSQLTEYSNSMNTMIDLQMEANNDFAKASDILYNSVNELAKTFGREINLRDVVNNSLAKTRRQTGGATDPTDITRNILNLENSRKILQDASNSAASKGPSGTDEFQLMQNRLRNNNLALRQNYDALKNLAENTDIASAALAKIQEIQQRRQAGANLIEKLVTSSPEELAKLNSAMGRLNNNMQGIANRGTSSEQRGETLQLFNQIAPLLGDGATQNALKANVLESQLLESGMGINPMFAQILDSLRSPEGDSEMQQAIKVYEEGNKLQSVANTRLGEIKLLMNENTATVAAEKLKVAITGAKLTFDQTLLSEINKGIISLKDLVAKRAPAAAGLATGGVVYASTGKSIDFAPRGTDTVPAMLTPGEFVVNRKATRSNLPLLQNINSGKYNKGGRVSYLADGGIVPGDDWKTPLSSSTTRSSNREREDRETKDSIFVRIKQEPNLSDASTMTLVPAVGYVSHNGQKSINLDGETTYVGGDIVPGIASENISLSIDDPRDPRRGRSLGPTHYLIRYKDHDQITGKNLNIIQSPENFFVNSQKLSEFDVIQYKNKNIYDKILSTFFNNAAYQNASNIVQDSKDLKKHKIKIKASPPVSFNEHYFALEEELLSTQIDIEGITQKYPNKFFLLNTHNPNERVNDDAFGIGASTASTNDMDQSAYAIHKREFRNRTIPTKNRTSKASFDIFPGLDAKFKAQLENSKENLAKIDIRSGKGLQESTESKNKKTNTSLIEDFYNNKINMASFKKKDSIFNKDITLYNMDQTKWKKLVESEKYKDLRDDLFSWDKLVDLYQFSGYDTNSKPIIDPGSVKKFVWSSFPDGMNDQEKSLKEIIDGNVKPIDQKLFGELSEPRPYGKENSMEPSFTYRKITAGTRYDPFRRQFVGDPIDYYVIDKQENNESPFGEMAFQKLFIPEDRWQNFEEELKQKTDLSPVKIPMATNAFRYVFDGAKGMGGFNKLDESVLGDQYKSMLESFIPYIVPNTINDVDIDAIKFEKILRKRAADKTKTEGIDAAKKGFDIKLEDGEELTKAKRVGIARAVYDFAKRAIGISSSKPQNEQDIDSIISELSAKATELSNNTDKAAPLQRNSAAWLVNDAYRALFAELRYPQSDTGTFLKGQGFPLDSKKSFLAPMGSVPVPGFKGKTEAAYMDYKNPAVVEGAIGNLINREMLMKSSRNFAGSLSDVDQQAVTIKAGTARIQGKDGKDDIIPQTYKDIVNIGLNPRNVFPTEDFRTNKYLNVLETLFDTGTDKTGDLVFNPGDPKYLTASEAIDSLKTWYLTQQDMLINTGLDRVTKIGNQERLADGTDTSRDIDKIYETSQEANAFLTGNEFGPLPKRKQLIDMLTLEINEPITPITKARGGLIYASAGQLVNYQPRGTDTVPAMLTPGEFVVNRSATQKNLPLLKSINSGTYNKGGIIYAQRGGEISTSVQSFSPLSDSDKLINTIIGSSKPNIDSNLQLKILNNLNKQQLSILINSYNRLGEATSLLTAISLFTGAMAKTSAPQALNQAGTDPSILNSYLENLNNALGFTKTDTSPGNNLPENNIPNVDINPPDWLPITIPIPDWLPIDMSLSRPEWIDELNTINIPRPIWIDELQNLQVASPEWLPISVSRPEWLDELIGLPTTITIEPSFEIPIPLEKFGCCKDESGPPTARPPLPPPAQTPVPERTRPTVFSEEIPIEVFDPSQVSQRPLFPPTPVTTPDSNIPNNLKRADVTAEDIARARDRVAEDVKDLDAIIVESESRREEQKTRETNEAGSGVAGIISRAQGALEIAQSVQKLSEANSIIDQTKAGLGLVSGIGDAVDINPISAVGNAASLAKNSVEFYQNPNFSRGIGIANDATALAINTAQTTSALGLGAQTIARPLGAVGAVAEVARGGISGYYDESEEAQRRSKIENVLIGATTGSATTGPSSIAQASNAVLGTEIQQGGIIDTQLRAGKSQLRGMAAGAAIGTMILPGAGTAVGAVAGQTIAGAGELYKEGSLLARDRAEAQQAQAKTDRMLEISKTTEIDDSGNRVNKSQDDWSMGIDISTETAIREIAKIQDRLEELKTLRDQGLGTYDSTPIQDYISQQEIVLQDAKTRLQNIAIEQIDKENLTFFNLGTESPEVQARLTEFNNRLSLAVDQLGLRLVDSLDTSKIPKPSLPAVPTSGNNGYITPTSSQNNSYMDPNYLNRGILQPDGSSMGSFDFTKYLNGLVGSLTSSISQAFDKALTNLKQPNNATNGVSNNSADLKNIDNFVNRLNNIANILSNIYIPPNITITGKHDVNVTINGDTVLNQLRPDIAGIVVSAIKGAFRDLKAKNPENNTINFDIDVDPRSLG